MKLKEISILEAPFLWDEAKEFLAKAVSDEEPEDYLRQIKANVFAGTNTLWQISDDFEEPIGYAVSYIYTTDGVTNIVQISLAATDSLEQLLKQLDAFETWVEGIGADYIEVVGRKSWERILKPFGFNHNYTSLIKRAKRELH